MITTRSITKIIRKRITSNSSIHIDELNNNLIRGWVSLKSNTSSSIVIEIYSSNEKKCIIANEYRPDVRRTGSHCTGFCGFTFDISSWADKDVAVRILGECSTPSMKSFTPSFFIHIPKTAGTSFKRASEKYFGADGVVKNYGAKSSETTAWVKDVVLNDKNYPLLYDNLSRNGIGLYTGHVHALPTANIFQIQNIITFLRNPLEQVISHFNHFSRWYEYKKNISEFVITPGFKNLQSRHLNGLPIQLVGFIGITEKYSVSIDLLNTYYGWDFEAREDNANEKKNITSVEKSINDLVDLENADDFRLYACVDKLFEERRALNALDKEWCYSFIDQLDEKHVSGVAYMAKSVSNVSVLIFEKDKQLGCCVANELRLGLIRFGVPNKGFIGFSFILPKSIDLSEILVVVETTGQVLQNRYDS
jgi:hypothetical protein